MRPGRRASSWRPCSAADRPAGAAARGPGGRPPPRAGQARGADGGQDAGGPERADRAAQERVHLVDPGLAERDEPARPRRVVGAGLDVREQRTARPGQRERRVAGQQPALAQPPRSPRPIPASRISGAKYTTSCRVSRLSHSRRAGWSLICTFCASWHRGAAEAGGPRDQAGGSRLGGRCRDRAAALR